MAHRPGTPAEISARARATERSRGFVMGDTM